MTKLNWLKELKLKFNSVGFELSYALTGQLSVQLTAR